MSLRVKLDRLQTWLEWPAAKPQPANRAAALQDYAVYMLTRRQFGAAAIVGCVCAFAAAFLFYRSVTAAALLSIAGVVAPRYYRASLLERRRTRLALQFKEALYSLTSSLAAGRSVENAFISVLDDLRLLYPDPNAEVLIEFEIIRTRLSYGEPLEQSLADFGRRAAIDEITQFVDVFVTCKRTGGDLVEVIRRTSQTIGEKLDVQQEIAVLLAQKRFESRIMMSVPFLFLAFLGFAAPDYMAPLYSGIGYVLLTGALLMLGGCYWLMGKVMDIRV
ncbi:type II secretion system F family protein [Paenibacillus spongiae]|uniref:Type II secretion system F family protein n=1 Tax=Paenibacillus spongiae TaxID=2909671 RepID=A0ABY5SBU9_9BACL|nr:type II secretion system F family protein [Paenibacillus spongiae]UVI31419.1 type II secretion system F family protein [Paenibacillus spongiae]